MSKLENFGIEYIEEKFPRVRDWITRLIPKRRVDEASWLDTDYCDKCNELFKNAHGLAIHKARKHE